jgi:hypothetical protein
MCTTVLFKPNDKTKATPTLIDNCGDLADAMQIKIGDLIRAGDAADELPPLKPDQCLCGVLLRDTAEKFGMKFRVTDWPNELGDVAIEW